MFMKRNISITTEISDLKISIEELEKTCHNKSELKKAKELFVPMTVHILDCYDSMTVEDKNHLWKLLMEKITYYRSPTNPGSIEIHLYPKLGQFLDT